MFDTEFPEHKARYKKQTDHQGQKHIQFIIVSSNGSTQYHQKHRKNLIPTPRNFRYINYMSLRSSKESKTGTSHHSWDLCPNTTPISLTCSFLSFQGILPLIVQLPLSGVNIPLNTFMVLLLPASLGPIYPTISPSSIVKEISSSALIHSYSL